MHRSLGRRLFPIALSSLACWSSWSVGSADAAPPKAGDQVWPTVPWVHVPAADIYRSPVARAYGLDEVPPVEGFWQGTNYFDKDSYARSILTAQGLPVLPALDYEPTAGILYVAMTGVTLRPSCGNGDAANAALDCSPLVSAETTFPAYGNGSQQSALFQELQGYYEPFNIILTNERPPDWVPYTMAVIGGSSGQAGQEQGVCGVANVACDGLKRNHVSLTFPESCGGVAEIAAQETSHNWGLEHTDNTQDLLYPFNNGGVKSFVDDCMEISHATGSAITQCTFVHELYCPEGEGEQQNTFQELLGVFGPREVDSIAPSIVSTTPADGAVMDANGSFTVSAKVEENSRFLAVNWTWLEGQPEGDEPLRGCTNGVCDFSFEFQVGTDPNEINWDFVNFTNPPPGTYSFELEVADAYGNYDSQIVTFTVEGEPGESTSGDDSGDGTDGGTGEDDDGPEPTGGDPDAGDESAGPGQDDGGSAGADDADAEGCGCGLGDSPTPWTAGLGLVVLAAIRRRRR